MKPIDVKQLFVNMEIAARQPIETNEQATAKATTPKPELPPFADPSLKWHDRLEYYYVHVAKKGSKEDWEAIKMTDHIEWNEIKAELERYIETNNLPLLDSLVYP